MKVNDGYYHGKLHSIKKYSKVTNKTHFTMFLLSHVTNLIEEAWEGMYTTYILLS